MKKSKISKASALISFFSYFASKRAAKFGVFFIVFGTSLLLPLDSAGATQTGPVQVICATTSGEQRTFTPSWDNTNIFFSGKGQISRLFCEGGYAGNYRVFVSNNLRDSSLDYYNGIAPVVTTSSPVESQTPVSQPVDSPTAPSVPESPTVTAPPAPTNPDSSTATAPDTQTVQVDSPTVVVPESSTVVPGDNAQSAPTETPTLISDTQTVTVPVQSSEQTPQPAPAVQEPSPTPAPSVNEPAVVAPEPAPAQHQPVPDPAPVIDPPAPEPSEPPAIEPQPVEPPAPEPAPPAKPAEPESPAPNPEPAIDPVPVAQVDPITPVLPAPPQVFDPSPNPVSVLDVDVATLPPDTPVELENGVILTAEVVVALQLLENPAELLGAIFSDPGQALMALANIGADMSPEVRAKSEKVVVSAIIVGGIATQAAGIAAASTYRRNP